MKKAKFRAWEIIMAGLLFASPALAQDFPFKPLPTVRVHLTCAGHLDCAEDYNVEPNAKWYRDIPVRRPTADKKFLASTILSGVLTVADVENSVYALRRNDVREANPLYGSHPGRGRYYAISMPIFAFTSYMSYRWKRQDDALRDASFGGHKWAKWWLPETLNSASHLVGIWTTLGSTGR